MSAAKDGGPAFPGGSVLAGNHGAYDELSDGMTLRDYFAAQALTGLMANPDITPNSHEQIQKAARRLYEFADAMLAARAAAK